MINMEDDRVSGEEERSEAKTDFRGLREPDRREHRSEVRRRGGGKLESGRAN